MNWKFFKSALTATAAGLLVVACGGGSDDLPDRTNTATPQLRMVHAAPVAPALTLYRNGAKDFGADDVSYRHASNFHDMSTGLNTLSLRLAATDTGLTDLTIDAQRGRQYTALALPDGASAGLTLIDDPYEKGLISTNARVRVVNASTNAQNIDVYISAPGVDLATLSPTFPGLGYKQIQPASGVNALDLDSGNYQLRITPAGSKTAFFDAFITLDKNVDWLLLTVPSDRVGLIPNAVQVLRVLSDDPTSTAIEISSP